MNDDELYELYQEERRAYANYIDVRDKHSRRPTLVFGARRRWHYELKHLMDAATWAEVRAMLERRGVKDGKAST